MSGRAARSTRAPIVVTAVSVALIGGGTASQFLLVSEPRAFRVWEVAFAIALVTVGGVLTARRPEARIGWVYAVSGAAGGGMVALGGLDPGWSPALTGPAVAIAGWIWLVAFGGPVTLGLLWFPDGPLAGAGWRAVERIVLLCFAVAIVTGSLLTPEITGGDPGYTNPLAVVALAWLLEPIFLVSAGGVLVGAGACALSLVVRWRRADGRERHQIKWLALAGAFAVVTYATGDLTTRLPVVTWDLIAYGSLVLVSASVAVAVTRYRLYDIDRIVSRTVSYLLLTGVLVAVYAAAVVALRAVLAPVTGQSDVAVAGSTLAVAALFGPVRRRVQSIVDRRFNRPRYDAAWAVADFGQRLRDEVDLDHVAAGLRETVDTVVQPASVWVWLPQPRREART